MQEVVEELQYSLVGYRSSLVVLLLLFFFLPGQAPKSVSASAIIDKDFTTAAPINNTTAQRPIQRLSNCKIYRSGYRHRPVSGTPLRFDY